MCGKILSSLYTYKTGKVRVFGKPKWAYKGLSWRSHDVVEKSSRFTLNDTVIYKPDSFLLAERQPEYHKYIAFTGDTINGIRLTKEVIFFHDGTYKIFVGCYEVNANILGIGDTVLSSANDGVIIFDIFAKCKICKGHVLDHQATNRVVELWSNVGQSEGVTERRVRSGTCDRVLSFSSTSDSCRRCQITIYKEKPTYKCDNPLIQDKENLLPSSTNSTNLEESIEHLLPCRSQK
jgi:hypothetical protein